MILITKDVEAFYGALRQKDTCSANPFLELESFFKTPVDDDVISIIADQHFSLCKELLLQFMQRPDLDPLDEKEKLLLPALRFIQVLLAAKCEDFEALFLKSNMLKLLSKFVAFYADITDFMVKDLSKACALETLVYRSQLVPSKEMMQQAIEMENVPESVLSLCECRNVVLEHVQECECLECIECEDVLAQESVPPQFRKPVQPTYKESGSEKQGKVIWPFRCLQFHKAALCCVKSYWNLLEFRSKKISQIINSRPIPQPGHFWIGIGDMIVVASKEISWISYEPTSPTAPILPEFVRAIVLTECPLPLRHGFRGLWLPDYAAKALCKPSALIPLFRSDPIHTWKPLLFIGNAFQPTPDDLLAVVINLIYISLGSGKIDDLLVILDGKGPWRAYQLIKCVEGETRIEFLAILNALASNCEKGSRGLIACCTHNFLADWFVWLIHSKKASDKELEILLDGLNLYLPRIEVKRWPKSRLIYGAANALMKCCPSEKILNQLKACIHTLTWDFGGRISKHRRNAAPQDDKGDAQRKLQMECLVRERNENCKVSLTLEKSSLADFNMVRKQWPGETWLLPCRSTLSLFAIPEPKLEDAVVSMKSKCPYLLRTRLYSSVVQGVHCEVLKVRGIRDIRQPAFSKIVCGMLNAGGGEIWIGLGNCSRIEGVFAHRSERDSFSQGVLDVATYSIEPRLLPFNLAIEHIFVFDKPAQELNPDRNRYVYKVTVKPLEGVNYLVLPEKVCLTRSEPNGVTVVKKCTNI
ncbi:uncharacterized protein LOC132195768 [Neocloeon triangulifer]|uniref:uncharacterized protein LOC132195768 n=1 Tax=Neocloeon triangulifer TaxID=2078957 RepID=UPI00286F06FE|nr:uncharacterized protein LOC132195768 [Neocloeon triangulifer]